MIQAMIAGVTALLISVLMPTMLLEPAEQAEPLFLVMEQPERVEEDRLICVKSGNEILELPMETYITGVVLSEMPASFEPEALKAQAVAARTFAEKQMEGGKHTDCDVCADSRCCQAWNSREAMEEKLGDAWEQYWQKASHAVMETSGEVLTYEGNLIDAVYFSCSGGRTEDAVAVWGSDIPYLQSVVSGGEEQASAFSSHMEFTHQTFQNCLSGVVNLPENPAQWIGEICYSEGGGVLYMELGGVPISGTELRNLLGLNSTQFTVTVTEETVVFDVLGYGHRVGLSQYGANAMAKQGCTYEEILNHYYTGVEIEGRR